MELRDHPLLTYRGIRSWPPVWTQIRGDDRARPRGEVGTLKEIHVAADPAGQTSGASGGYNRIFLFIEHEDRSYLGCLMMEDHAFCQQLGTLLQSQCGRTVAEIGSLDLGATL